MLQAMNSSKRPVGRPPLVSDFDVDINIFIVTYLNFCRERRMQWNVIAEHLGVDIKWLYNWRRKTNYIDPNQTFITDEDLDNRIRSYSADHPRRSR